MEDLFADRERDLQALEEQYRMKYAAFVVVYGRRRLGKTTLIKKFIEGKPAVYFLAENNAMLCSKDAFRDAAAAAFPDNPAFRENGPLDWEKMLEACCCSSHSEGRRTVIVLDEFQNLAAADRAFPSILQRIWDCSLQRRNVMLILCGSDIPNMLQKALIYSSPLYGRRTAQIRMRPIPFQSVTPLYEGRNLSRRELVERYSVTGGVPAYLERFREEPDLYGAIDRLVLDRRGPLYEEPLNLPSGELSDAATYYGLLSAIARGCHRQSQISAALEMEQTSITASLKHLTDLGLVERAAPATEEYPELSKKGMHFLRDPFLTFWFRFVYPRRSFLEIDRPAPVSELVRRNLAAWHGATVYESVCRETIWALGGTGQLPVPYNQVGSWWGQPQNSRVDILAVDSLGKRDILFGACKFQNEPVGTDVLADLMAKARQVPWGTAGRREVYAVFSISGFASGLKAVAEERRDILLLQ